MLKKTLLTALADLLLIVNCYSQKTIQKLYVNVEDTKTNPITISNGAGKTSLLIADWDKIHCFLLNDSLNSEKRVLLMEDARSLFKNKHLGNLSNGNIYSMFFYDKKTKGVLQYNLNFDSVEVGKKNSISLAASKDESFLDAANLGNKIQLLTVNKKVGTLFINEIDINGEVVRTPYKFFYLNDEDFEIVGGILFSGQTDFKKISYVGDVSLNTSQSDEKMYAFDNKIIFTYDKADMPFTAVLVLDLATKQSEFRKIRHSDVLYNGYSNIKYNSFLYDNKLFQVSSSYQALKVSVKNFATGDKIKEFNVERDQDIDFKNGAITQEGGSSYYSPESRELTKSNQLLRKIDNSKVAISVNKVSDSTLVMIVGSYLEVKRSVGMPMKGPGFDGVPNGIPIGVVGGITFSVNPFAIPGLYNYSNSRLVKSAYFKSLINPSDFSHIKGDLNKSKFDKINDYEEKLDNAKATTVFAKNDDFIYGYYDKETKTYNLVRF